MQERNTACFNRPQALTVATVAALREELLSGLEAADGEATFRVDASVVDTVDAAGIQLLVALEREATARQSRLTLLALSPTLEEALARLGLDAALAA